MYYNKDQIYIKKKLKGRVLAPWGLSSISAVAELVFEGFNI